MTYNSRFNPKRVKVKIKKTLFPDFSGLRAQSCFTAKKELFILTNQAPDSVQSLL